MTTIVTIDMGGTGATHAAGAREALSVPSMTDMGQSYAQANSARDQANTARDQANTARNTSNNAYAQANTGRSDANTTFASINTTFETVNTSLSTMNINLSSAQTWANIVSFAAYGQANTARGTANDAYAQANASYIQANASYIQANAAYGAANTRLSASGGTLSGDLIITGNLTVSGNQTILNTEVLTTEDADIILLSNTSSTPALNAGLIVNRGTSTNTFLRWDEALDEWGWSDSGTTTYYFEDLRQGLSTTNTTFSTINTSLGTINTNYQAAYAQANDAHGQANTAYGQSNAAYGQANAAYGQANAAYTRANTKLDSAGGTISGNLTVTGTLTVSGNVSSINTQSISSVSNEIILNSNASGAPTLDGKLTVNRGSSSNVTLLWNETADKWGWTDNGTTYYYFEDLRQGLSTTNTTFGTINTSYQAAYAQANTAGTNAGNAYGQANAAYAQANSAYGAANNRVLKAGDTMTGNLIISAAAGAASGTFAGGASLLRIQGSTSAFSEPRLDFGEQSLSPTAYIASKNEGNGGGSLIFGNRDTSSSTSTLTERLRIISTGNVAIGTTSASQRLTVNGAIQLTSSNPLYLFDTNYFVRASTGLELQSGDFIRLLTNGANERVRVDANGNVGIGTNSPSTRLHLYNTSGDVELRLSADGSSDPMIRLTGENNGTGEGFRLWYDNSVGDTYFDSVWSSGTATNPAIRFRTQTDTTAINAMTITHNGNVGIGSLNPGSKLRVEGVTDSTGNIYARSGIQFFRVNGAGTGLSFYNSTYSSWCIYMSPTGVANCGPHGNFTSPGSGHGVTSWALRSFIENSSGYGFTWETGTSSGNPTVIAGLEASTGNFSVAGTVTANSDRRVKKNIRPIENALDKIKEITGVHFEKIDTGEKSIGVIAQDVEKVLPEVVKLSDPNNPDSIKSVAYGNMVGLLIEAIKEQQQQIDELKSKLSV